MNLFSLDGQVHFGTILVAGESVELCAESLFQEVSEQVACRCRAAGAAFWWGACLPHVIYCLVRSIGAHINDLFDLGWSAEPGESRPIELNFFPPNELIEIEPSSNPS